MKSNKTWIALAAPIIGMVLLGCAALFWINGVENSAWISASQGNAILGVFTVIAAITLLNCGVLIGVALIGKRLLGRGA